MSLDIDPRKVRHADPHWMGGLGAIQAFKESREFEDRLFVARNKVSYKPGPLRTESATTAPSCTVSLADFWDSGRLDPVDHPPEFPQQSTRPTSALADYADDPRWPPELDIAVTAWRAACNNADRENMRPGEYIRKWLGDLYPTLSSEAVSRIAKIANWDKTAGRAKK